MRRLSVAPLARGDLVNIRTHIAFARPLAAERMMMKLATAFASLPSNPGIGRPGIVPGTRELVTVKPYVIVYRYTDELLEISRVFHAAQDR